MIKRYLLWGAVGLAHVSCGTVEPLTPVSADKFGTAFTQIDRGDLPDEMVTETTPAGPTYVRGTLSGATLWTLAGSPYIFQGNVTVANDATLIISPGVEIDICFEGTDLYEKNNPGKGIDCTTRYASKSLTINGCWVVQGTVDHPVTLKNISVIGSRYNQTSALDIAGLSMSRRNLYSYDSVITVRNSIFWDVGTIDLSGGAWGDHLLEGNQFYNSSIKLTGGLGQINRAIIHRNTFVISEYKSIPLFSYSRFGEANSIRDNNFMSGFATMVGASLQYQGTLRVDDNYWYTEGKGDAEGLAQIVSMTYGNSEKLKALIKFDTTLSSRAANTPREIAPGIRDVNVSRTSATTAAVYFETTIPVPCETRLYFSLIDFSRYMRLSVTPGITNEISWTERDKPIAYSIECYALTEKPRLIGSYIRSW